MTQSPILVTSALPYANGSIHLGHLVEYIQTDILVRFYKLTGRDAIYLCADDTHGTPIEINARKLGITPEELIARFYEEHQRDFNGFHIAFDEYYSTHSPENYKHATYIFQRLREQGHIVTREVEQLYCEVDQRFLPDRYIRGTCPNCSASDQYGDVCEVCGSTYETTDLINPKCALCGNPPVIRRSLHYFFRLRDFETFLREWIAKPGRIQPEIRRYIENWMVEGLRDWDISRDGPYFGFKIPGEADKYFYVWLDAPVGYIATTEKYCHRVGRDFDAYWHNPDARIIHVIGKDIVYFHTLFWPAMLKGAGYSLPSRVIVHGFLTVNGEKMSKSRGTFITARTYLEHLDPQYLRYYYAAKLSDRPDDLDLNFDDFVFRVNAELVNKIANLVSRVVPFVHKRFAGRLGSLPAETALLDDVFKKARAVLEHYDSLAFNRAIETIVDIAEAGNKYFQDSAPWAVYKKDPERSRAICTLTVNLCALVAALIKPVLPRYCEKVEKILNLGTLDLRNPTDIRIVEREVSPFETLVERVDQKKIEAMSRASTASDSA